MNRTDLQRVLGLDERATKGPWIIVEEGVNGRIDSIGPIAGYDYDSLELEPGDPDAELVSAYRTLAPAMAADLLAIHEALDRHQIDLGYDELEFIAAVERILGRNP